MKIYKVITDFCAFFFSEFRFILLSTFIAVVALIIFQKPSEVRLAIATQAATYEIQEKPNWTDKIFDPVAIFTLLLFFATAALYRSTKDLVIGAEITTINQLRAYVSVKEFIVNPVLDQRNQLIARSISVVFPNTGSTPTRDLIMHVNVWHDTSIFPENFRFPDTWMIDRKQQHLPMTLAPGTHHSDGNVRVSTEQLLEIESKKMRMFIYGYADYNDVFENTERHRTEFYVELICDGDPRAPSAANVGFYNYHEHNGTDKECMRTPQPLIVKRRRILPLK